MTRARRRVPAPYLRPRRAARRAATLLELVLALAVLAIAAAIALPAQAAARDAQAVRAATRELVDLLATAHELAVARGAAAVYLDSAADVVRLRAPGAPPGDLALGALHGVRVEATRDSLAFDGRGLGRGAANLRVVVRRGAAADTVVVSRLGRVRY